MDSYDKALLDYTTRWCNFGGGDEDIFTEFGLTPEVFYRRVLALLEQRFVTELEFPARQYLRAYCTEKLTASAHQRRAHAVGL
ncbi:hypothetical protein CBI38_32120 (plasmid) [Rhodococcus oxybenzonivorans]|jgi:hypothetical protein|uniref:DUF3263 domain-containing protein n=1 Tax=Rhodococcus oxybenzonivorans TaxID=1990687 RepID=A0A2S2C5I7_9NOCA|nr:hypothetical protein [Rhodococcus oxybenzonivorans]AWK76157.1 hypothetical protein CBI38_32120 [Rhodococcus oxybenzonivorans]